MPINNSNVWKDIQTMISKIIIHVAIRDRAGIVILQYFESTRAK